MYFAAPQYMLTLPAFLALTCHAAHHLLNCTACFCQKKKTAVHLIKVQHFLQGLKLVRGCLEDETESDLALIEGKPTVITMKTIFLTLIMTNEIIIIFLESTYAEDWKF